MTAFPARWRSQWKRRESWQREALLSLGWRAYAAERVATAIRQVGLSVPGVGGPLLVSLGLWMAWRPLGVVFAGAVLWALDRRVP